MNQAIEKLQAALEKATSERPSVGGFPHFAESLRLAGAIRNHWALPSCQSTFWMTEGNVVIQGEPLANGFIDVPKFDEEAVIRAIREDQAGRSTFPEFLAAVWAAGVLTYDVDFEARTVAYHGANGEVYLEEYPAVTVTN